jgi:hypothetical protein
VGFVVDKVALGQVFSEYFRFSLPIFIPPIAPQSPSSIIWRWYSRPVVAAVPSGLSLTPLRIIQYKNYMKLFLLPNDSFTLLNAQLTVFNDKQLMKCSY